MKSIKKKIAIGFVLFPWSAIAAPMVIYWHKSIDVVAHFFGVCVGH